MAARSTRALPGGPGLLTLLALIAGSVAGPAAAQDVVVRAGAASAVTGVAPGAELAVPLQVDIAAGAEVDVASLSLRLSWDPTRLEYLGTEAGDFGTLTINDGDAATGTLRLAVFSATGSTVSLRLARLRFAAVGGGAAEGGVSGVPVHIEVTAVGDESGASIAAAAGAVGCVVCVADLLGDVNADGEVNIIDAQQIARQVVELPVTDELRFPDYADVNADGAADIVDAQQIARCAVGLSVPGEWCGTSCDQLFAGDSVVVNPSFLGLVQGDIGELVARPYQDGSPAAWPADGAAAWGIVNTDALAAPSFQDSVVTFDAVADGTARFTARLGTVASAPADVRVGEFPTGDFHIELRYLASTSAEHQAAMEAAATRWMEIITGDIADHPLNVDGGGCHPAMNETVDDLIIFVEIIEIDGESGVLGSAGPCYYRTATGLPITGLVRLDEADVDAMIADGSFEDVIVHEIGHVLGLGTLWEVHDLLTGAGGEDPFFTGTRAIDAFIAAGGDSYDGNPVPVENSGGSGTRDGHWRESVFDNELMTGFINAGSNPLSAVTVGSFEDMGYTVSYAPADAYSLPAAAILGDTSLRFELREQLITTPIPVDPEGRPAAIPPQ